jgi:hypothetical protein
MNGLEFKSEFVFDEGTVSYTRYFNEWVGEPWLSTIVRLNDGSHYHGSSCGQKTLDIELNQEKARKDLDCFIKSNQALKERRE